MKIKQVNSTSSGIHNTAYHNGSYLLSCRKRKLQSLEISCEYFLLL